MNSQMIEDHTIMARTGISHVRAALSDIRLRVRNKRKPSKDDFLDLLNAMDMLAEDLRLANDAIYALNLVNNPDS